MNPEIYNFDEYLDDDGNVISLDYFDGYLPGHNVKSFVRCESDIFWYLFDEIKYNQNCSYVTYINDFIKDNYDDEVLPIATISCFKKDADHNAIEETISRLANLLGVPTTYVVCIPPESDEDRVKRITEFLKNAQIGDSFSVNNGYVLSVDFIGANEKFETLDAYTNKQDYPYFLGGLCDDNCNLRSWYSKWVLTRDEEFINPITNESVPKDIKLQLFREFLPQYFFRKYIAKDRDLKSENIGILYNEVTGEYKLAPMFDTEYCFHDYIPGFSEYNCSQLKDEIMFAYRLAPNIMEEFITRIWDVYHANLINEDWIAMNAYNLRGPLQNCILRSLDDFVDHIPTREINDYYFD